MIVVFEVGSDVHRPQGKVAVEVARAENERQVRVGAAERFAFPVGRDPVHAGTAPNREPFAHRLNVFDEQPRIRRVRARDREVGESPRAAADRVERVNLVQFLFEVSQVRTERELPAFGFAPRRRDAVAGGHQIDVGKPREIQDATCACCRPARRP